MKYDDIMNRLSAVLRLCAASVILAVPLSAFSQEVIVDLRKKGAEIPSSLYGVFFEEITGSGDGGL